MNDNKLLPPVEGVLLSRLAAYFLHLGTIGFGGPIALVSYVQRDLVEHRQWVWL
jgi:chromate transport protein ChrA